MNKNVFQEMMTNGYKHVTDNDAEWVKIDTNIAEMSVCPKCNRYMKYEGYVRTNPNTSYRAFAVCQCGHYEEF